MRERGRIGRARTRITVGGRRLWPVKKRQSRVDGQVCPSTRLVYSLSTCGFALRNLHKSPRVQVGSAPHTQRACKLHSPPTSGDWCRFRAAGRGLRPAAACGRPRVAGRRRARRCPGRSLRMQAPTEARASGCTFFAVCCGGGRARGTPPLASPRKTAGQTNDNE